MRKTKEGEAGIDKGKRERGDKKEGKGSIYTLRWRKHGRRGNRKLRTIVRQPALTLIFPIFSSFPALPSSLS